ncbi:MAG: acyl-CoA synthetase [Deltaproteobacteria bacterium]
MYPAVHAKERPDKAACIMGAGGQVTSYAALDAASNRIAHLMRRLGLKRGDAVAILVENSPRFFEVCWAAQRAGLYYTPISTHLTAEEAAYIIDDSDSRVLFSSAAMAETARPLAPLTTGLTARFMTGGDIPGYEHLEDAIASESEEPITDESEGSEMLYSSGTTGRPKGIRRPLPDRPIGTPSPMMQALASGMFGANEDTVYLSPAPLYHSAPLRFTMTMLRIGATIVVMERFDARLALELIERHGVTMSQWVPTHFIRMLELDGSERAGFELGSHKVALHAAAPCPVPVKEQMIDWWGPILVEYYSATEGNGSTIISSTDWLAHRGSVGRAMGCSIHITGEEGQELPTGEPGTVYFEGGGQFSYHKDEEKTDGTRHPQGWTTVGDIGYLDEDGYLYLTDRKAHMIISGGVNIYPQETENLLIMHSKVRDVAVIGVPDTEFGEAVKAVVQPVNMAEAGPELEAELMEFCRNGLSSIKCPRSVDFEAEIPRSETGKLHKAALKERYWSGHQTRIV